MSDAFIRKSPNSTVFESIAGRVENNGFGNILVHGEKEGLFDGGGGVGWMTRATENNQKKKSVSLVALTAATAVGNPKDTQWSPANVGGLLSWTAALFILRSVKDTVLRIPRGAERATCGDSFGVEKMNKCPLWKTDNDDDGRSAVISLSAPRPNFHLP